MNRTVVLLTALFGLIVLTVSFYIYVNYTPSGPELEGSVTLGGEPIQRGTIVFSPNLAENNDGISARGEIQDGKFRLLKGSVFTPGANIATVTDFTLGDFGFSGAVAIPTQGASDLKVEIEIPEGIDIEELRAAAAARNSQGNR